jgi:hypothetical protein
MYKLASTLLLFAAALPAQTSSYPGALDSSATLLTAQDNVQSVLSAPMLASDTKAYVTSSTGWQPNMIAYICEGPQTAGGICSGSFEEMLVTSVASQALTVTRGVGGTTAIAHAANRYVTNAITASYHAATTSAILAIESTLGASLSNVSAGPWVQSAKYVFAPQTPGGSLFAGGAGQVITLTPCPLGVNGSDANHYLYLSGGTGTAEATLITGGTCTSGAASGTITVTPAYAHSGAWTIGSATNGQAEAVAATPNGAVIVLPVGTLTERGTVTLGPNHSFVGQGRNVTIVSCTSMGSAPCYYYSAGNHPGPEWAVNISIAFSAMQIDATNGIVMGDPPPATHSGQADLVTGPMIRDVIFNGTYGGVSDPNRATTVVPTLTELQGYGTCVALTKTFDAILEGNAFNNCGIAVLNNGSDITNVRSNRFYLNARNIHTTESLTDGEYGNSLKVDHNDIIGVQREGGIYIDGAGFADITSNFFEGTTFTGASTIGQYLTSANAWGTMIHSNRFDSADNGHYLIYLDDRYNVEFTHNTWNPNFMGTPIYAGHTYWNSGNPNIYLFADNVFDFGTATGVPAAMPIAPGAVLEKLDPLFFSFRNVPNNFAAGLCSTSFMWALSPATGRWIANCNAAPNTGLVVKFILPTSGYAWYNLRLTGRKINTGITGVTVTYQGIGLTTAYSSGTVALTSTSEVQTLIIPVAIPAGESRAGYFLVYLDGTNAEWESLQLVPAAQISYSGTCTFSGTTCTVTFLSPFHFSPACTANDQTAAAAVQVAPSISNVVLTGGTGAGATDVVAYSCGGN